MKSDIEIAQEAAMIPVKEVAARYGIKEDDLELYGKYKAKLTDELWNQIKDRPDGKLVLVTAINPTPAGKDNCDSRLGRSIWKNGKKFHYSAERAVPWPLLWHQGRSCWRRLCPGCAYGGFKSAFYR